MAKFKVGDKVRVRKDLIPDTKYGDVYFVYSMKNMCGKIVTIKDFYSDNCNMYLKEIGYLWSPEMLEPVKEDKLIFNGNATILFKDGKKYVTKCDASDTYDREKGLLTVLAKANGYNYETIQEMLKNATTDKDMEVREVKRKAKVGEYIKIVDATMNGYNCIAYENGDICKVIKENKKSESDGIWARTRGTHNCNIGENTSFIFDDEYVVLENYKPKEKKENVKR